MNRDARAIRQLMAWLLQEPRPMTSAPSGEISSQQAGPDESGVTEKQWHPLDPLDSEEASVISASSEGLSDFPIQESPLLQMGEIPAVQDRFHTILKRRLRAEIERHPPLFPWESEICEYEAEASGSVVSNRLPTVQLWSAQLQHLNLPVPMPEAVLSQLLEQCRTVAHSSLREGARLVKAVESLFPGQSPALNQLAGLVLAAPARSGAMLAQRSSQAEPLGFPDHYDAATAAQQMVLSLLAAREILQSLTLTVSPSQPQVQRQWQTHAGSLALETDYHPAAGRVRIQAHLPCAGRARFQGNATEAIAHRDDPGYISVELFNLEPHQSYTLEIQLGSSDQSPLTFTICPVTELGD